MHHRDRYAILGCVADSRFDLVCTNARCGERFVFTGTKQAFIDNDHRCPECRSIAKRARFEIPRGIPCGGKALGMRIGFPYYNFQLPVRPGQKPGEQIVESKQHLREIAAGAWDGQQYDVDQI